VINVEGLVAIVILLMNPNLVPESGSSRSGSTRGCNAIAIRKALGGGIG
jgi:hypothetical protein